MKWLSALMWRPRTKVWLVLIAVAIGTASVTPVVGADAKTAEAQAPKSTAAKTNAPAAKKPAPKPEKKDPKDPKPDKKAVKQLTGAELYSLNCNRCHAERYPMEWTAAQWQTLILHMRVRANLPASQARRILKYLQEDSGS